MATFVAKAPPLPEGADVLRFDGKTMWRGKTIQAGDEVFLFAAEHHGGHGISACGIVTEATRGPGIRIAITVRSTKTATRPLGRADLRPVRDLADGDPGKEIDHKLYVQAANKVAGISDAASAYLRGFF